jgi:hypothetical protein
VASVSVPAGDVRAGVRGRIAAPEVEADVGPGLVEAVVGPGLVRIGIEPNRAGSMSIPA